jgi:hypothetical protein
LNFLTDLGVYVPEILPKVKIMPQTHTSQNFLNGESHRTIKESFLRADRLV